MTDLIQLGKSTDASPADSRRQWTSLAQLEGTLDLAAQHDADSPNGQLAAELAVSQKEGVSRRGFMGAGLTLAAASSALSGCIRKPVEYIVPYDKRPEDLVPGNPVYFATSANFDGAVVGLLVESHEGRPTKIEGNPRHPGSLGGTNARLQASILDLYGSDRSQTPYHAAAASDWTSYDAWAGEHFGALRREGGKGIGLLLRDTDSPTLQRLVTEFRSAFPQARIYKDDATRTGNGAAGADLVGLRGLVPLRDLGKADVVLSVDADFLGTGRDMIRDSRAFAARRKVETVDDEMNRLYSVEAGFTLTGMAADNRLRLKSSLAGAFLAAVAQGVFSGGIATPPGASAVVDKLSGDGLPAAAATFAAAVAKDLIANRRGGSVLVGERQAPEVHALGLLLDAALGNVGRTLVFVPRHDISGARDLAALVADIDSGNVATLLVLGANPVFTAPGDIDFAASLAKVGHSVHLSATIDETSAACTWHLPSSHFLEAWGDHRASDGTISVQQPLIAPLFGTRSAIQILSGLLGGAQNGLELVQATWSNGSAGFVRDWRRWLHEGVVAGSEATPIAPVLQAPVAPAIIERSGGAPADAEGTSEGEAAIAVAPVPAPPAHTFEWSGLAAKVPTAAETTGIEVDFRLDNTIGDGRWSNNAWLQELPDPHTKLVWDNAALLSPATARSLGVEGETSLHIRGRGVEMVTVTVAGNSVSLAAWVAPGLADDVVVLPIGYGRTKGDVATGVGFGVNSLRATAAPWFAAGSVAKTSGEYELMTSQNHHSLIPRAGYPTRPVIREATLAHFRKEPGWVDELEMLPEDHLKSLWEQPNETGGQQWGMSIDLNSCTGCGTCVIACQAENNISVVGKERVGYGREMHWIRIDRYFTGDGDDPEALVQPMACAQCETAPCEGVCPVAATSHSPEGLNDMAYNRCIGTRYCAANCPFKVRRYNFFNYTKENEEAQPLVEWQRNPDVTPRFRGVMEKCTYCVQRINGEKIIAKRSGDGVVPDGRIVPACAQACPTTALVFGDIRDPNSTVSKWKTKRNEYAVLAELNIHPRTTFGAKLRNPNPDLA